MKIDDGILLRLKMMHQGIVPIRDLAFLLPHFSCRIGFTLVLSLHFLGLLDDDRVCVNAYTAAFTPSAPCLQSTQES